MGHTDISVTSNVYTHLKLEDAQREMERLESVIKPRKNKDIRGKTKICKIKLKCSWFATALQFYYNAGLCKVGQSTA